MLIYIKGVQFVNKGAELMLHAVIQQLELHWPNAKFALAPGPNSPFASRMAVGSLQYFPLSKKKIDLNAFSKYVPKKVRSWLKRSFGIVLECDIDLILDASGFAYGDQWPEVNTLALCAELQRFSQPGKAYVLLPQAFGPFSRTGERRRLVNSLHLATMVCAREASSFNYLVSLIGRVDNLYQFADFTNLVRPKRVVEYKNGDSKVLIIPNANMLSSRNQNSEWHDRYLPVLINAVEVISAMGLTPVLLNHEGEDDAAICLAVQEGAEYAVEIVTESDPLKVKGIIAASKAVLCSRFHGCVSALSQGVPCLGTSWSHKYERLFEEYGLLSSLLSPQVTKQQLILAFNQAFNHVNSKELETKRTMLRQQSEDLWQAVAVTVKQQLS